MRSKQINRKEIEENHKANFSFKKKHCRTIKKKRENKHKKGMLTCINFLNL
jgi:hypothetical protein